ncbi:BON domain-containing protein [Azohydromonas lata]|uniref:BON domain-containing protein n=1 Tax=Azohydromonas lata TaxID=45677 RepID=A0ABU5IGA1_9BURK|nr:BON domain-containing protein [Azohydromonas lata]MDZ5458144.1 BON domain-containing protein [Azohydromonas lata]
MSKLSSDWTSAGLRAARVLAALGAAAWMSGCAPLLVGGAAVGGALVATDRRTSGTQVEDQAIEVKAATRVREVLGERGHVNLTSYNRTLLITGEVPSEAERQSVERAIAGVENLRSVVNELGVLGNSSLTSRSSDAIITSKVKATFVDAKDLQSNAIKVVTERGTVYLMGRVTEREAVRAADLARNIGGVEKVVRVFEILTEAELANLQTAR